MSDRKRERIIRCRGCGEKCKDGRCFRCLPGGKHLPKNESGQNRPNKTGHNDHHKNSYWDE